MSEGERIDDVGDLVVALGPPVARTRTVPAVAAIVHLTDLHLDPPVDATNSTVEQRLLRDADTIPDPTTWTQLASAWQRLFGQTASRLVWESLPAQVRRIVAVQSESATPVLIAQTGDVEAFGQRSNGHYPGYEQLEQELLAPLRTTAGVTVHEVYGNHDIWPASAFGQGFVDAHAEGPETLVTVHAGVVGPPSSLADPWTHVDVPCPDGVTVRVHRVDTIDPQVMTGAIRAQGRIRSGPLVADGPAPGPAPELRLNTHLGAGPGVIDLVLSHHPLLIGKKGKAKVWGVEAVRQVLERRALVLSGHLHRLRPRAKAGKGKRPQVVSNSATVLGPTRRRRGARLSVYFVIPRSLPLAGGDDVAARVRIERHDYTPTLHHGWRGPKTVEELIP